MALEPCSLCSGLIDTERSTPLKVERRDDAGEVIIDPRTGKPQPITIQLAKHVFPPSTFDPTGLVMAACDHGLKEHPGAVGLPKNEANRRFARSWIRSKHLDQLGRCPVCYGQEAPDDMLVPANAS